MNKAAIERAVHEAKRFLERHGEWKRATATPERSWTDPSTNEVYRFYPNAPKESGALRRASLDLTRALAEMRKP